MCNRIPSSIALCWIFILLFFCDSQPAWSGLDNLNNSAKKITQSQTVHVSKDLKTIEKGSPASRSPKLFRSHLNHTAGLVYLQRHRPIGNEVRFIAHGKDHSLILKPTQSILRMKRQSSSSKEVHEIGMRWIGANPSTKVIGEAPLPGIMHYLKGRNPSRWQRSIHRYTKVRYRELYPGIDLVYHSHKGQPEFDFVIQPGADPKNIRLAFDGADTLSINGGNLILHTAQEDITLKAPYIYQLINGKKRPVGGNYAFLDGGLVSFYLQEYDRTRPLVIDPFLVDWFSYLGGSDGETVTGAIMDNADNVVVVGKTASSNFPTLNPADPSCTDDPVATDCNDPATVPFEQEGFVSKLSSDGTGIFSTFIGGKGTEDISFVKFDGNGNVIIAGTTTSTDFPLLNAFDNTCTTVPGATSCNEVFVAKLDMTGQPVFITYVGGDKTEEITGLEVDNAGNIYLAGNTRSPDFPTQSAFDNTCPITNAFNGTCDDEGWLVKLDPAGAVVYSTLVGGEDPDTLNVLEVDSLDGTVWVGGRTFSLDMGATPGAAQETCDNIPIPPFCNGDGWVAQISPNGQKIWLTYLDLTGGSGSGEVILQGEVDDTGTSYWAGQTSPFSGDLLAASYAQDGSLNYKQQIGGSNEETLNVFSLDPDTGDVVLGGISLSVDFPVVWYPGATPPVGTECNPQDLNTGLGNGIVIFLNHLGEIDFSVCLGNSTTIADFSLEGKLYAGGSTDNPNNVPLVNHNPELVPTHVKDPFFPDPDFWVGLFDLGEGTLEFAQSIGGEGNDDLNCYSPYTIDRKKAIQELLAFTTTSNRLFTTPDAHETGTSTNTEATNSAFTSVFVLSMDPSHRIDFASYWGKKEIPNTGPGYSEIGKSCMIDSFGGVTIVMETDTDGEATAGVFDETGSTGGILVPFEAGVLDLALDTDGDGSPNYIDLDDDNDGMPDAFEDLHGFDPLDPIDAALDADLDGVTNLNEFLFGTNPRDPIIDPVNDVMVNFSNPGVSVLFNDNSSSAVLHPDTATAIAVTDVEGNGEDDMVVSFPAGTGPDGTGGTYISRNRGDLTLLDSKTAEQIAVGNFDGIGGKDLLFDFGVDGLWIYLNGASLVNIIPDSPLSMVAGDVDNNNMDDMILSFNGLGTFVIRNFNAVQMLDSSPAEVLKTGDVDGNGEDDIIASFASGNGPGGTGGLFVAANQGPLTLLSSLQVQQAASGDFDGSGQDDFILDLGGTTGLWVFLNGANITFLTDVSPVAMASGDLDNNGMDDMVLSFDVFGTIAFKNLTTTELLDPGVALDLAIGNIDSN